jgi:hypothetical protein
LLPELLGDLNTGHNIIATVFEECRSMYRADGPVEMRPVGEVEFVAGIAAMSASGGYGPIKVAQGIVGYADLALGDRVEPVLEALISAGGGRFSGVRYSVGYDADPTIGNSRPDSAPHMFAAEKGVGYPGKPDWGFGFAAGMDVARVHPSVRREEPSLTAERKAPTLSASGAA